MKKIILILIGIFLIPFVFANVCVYEEVPDVGCKIITPGNLTCSTYSIYAENGTLLSGLPSMTELYSGSGVYNVTFNQSVSQGYTIHLCDGSTTTIKVGNSLFQEVDAVEENQVIIQNNIDQIWNKSLDTYRDNSTAGGTLFLTYSRVRDSISGIVMDILNELFGAGFG